MSYRRADKAPTPWVYVENHRWIEDANGNIVCTVTKELGKRIVEAVNRVAKQDGL